MKKITKLGALGLALAGCLVALNMGTQTSAITKEVSLTLNTGQNTCTIVDYDFGEMDVSVTDIELDALTGAITCTFLENGTGRVTLQLADLKDGTLEIGQENFNFALAAATHTGMIPDLQAITTTAFGATPPTTIYTKPINKLGSWESVLTIDGTIPGGTPGGQYTGNLELVIQPN